MKWLYYQFIYRRLMKLVHRFNWHHTRTIHPEGDTLLVCDWCGLWYLKERGPKYHLSTGEQAVMQKALRAASTTGATKER